MRWSRCRRVQHRPYLVRRFCHAPTWVVALERFVSLAACDSAACISHHLFKRQHNAAVSPAAADFTMTAAAAARNLSHFSHHFASRHVRFPLKSSQCHSHQTHQTHQEEIHTHTYRHGARIHRFSITATATAEDDSPHFHHDARKLPPPPPRRPSLIPRLRPPPLHLPLPGRVAATARGAARAGAAEGVFGKVAVAGRGRCWWCCR